MRKGKKLLIVGVLLIISSVVAYLFINSKTIELEKQMKQASEDYFKKYIRTIETTSAYDVTLKDLKQANKNGENYELKHLEKCNAIKTKTTITIDMLDGKISNIKVKLDC